MTKYLCPSLLPMTVINTMTKKAERENSLFDYTGGHQWKPGQELEAGTWRQGLTQRRWRCAALACSACFRMHPDRHLRGALPTVDWGLTHQSSTKKTAPQT